VTAQEDVTMANTASATQFANASNYQAPSAMKGLDDIQVVEFLLGMEHFAIDLFDVKEVVEYTRITELPNAPQNIKGIIDLRGEITTILDIKQMMNIRQDSSRSETNSRIVVIDNKITKSKIGIIVDDVLSVSTFSRSDMDDTASSAIENLLINGIIRKKTKIKDSSSTELVIWINIKSILNECGLGIGSGT
jgi:purine-binding chemotaxis protein CheW